MIIDSVPVAVKEIVVSLWILPYHSLSLPESIVGQVVWVTAYQTRRIGGSPGGWLDFSDDQPDFIPFTYDRASQISLTLQLCHCLLS